MTSIGRMSGSFASRSPPTWPSAWGISPSRCAWRPSSVSNVSKMPNVVLVDAEGVPGDGAVLGGGELPPAAGTRRARRPCPAWPPGTPRAQLHGHVRLLLRLRSMMPRRGSHASGPPGRTGSRTAVNRRQASGRVAGATHRRAARRSGSRTPAACCASASRTAARPLLDRGQVGRRQRRADAEEQELARQRRQRGVRRGARARRRGGAARRPSAPCRSPGRRPRPTRRSPQAAARRAAGGSSGRGAAAAGSMCIRARPAGAIAAIVSISGPRARSGARSSAACASVPSSATSIVAKDRPRSGDGSSGERRQADHAPTEVATSGAPRRPVVPGVQHLRRSAPRGRTASRPAARAPARGRTRSPSRRRSCRPRPSAPTAGRARGRRPRGPGSRRRARRPRRSPCWRRDRARGRTSRGRR